MPIDVTELFSDPDFAGAFTIIRTNGEWAPGGEFAPGEPEHIPCVGAAQPARPAELALVPEGERKSGAVVFYVPDAYEVRLTGQGGLSDKILWRGDIYKIVSIKEWKGHGWSKAVGIREGAP
jgi:hypothetical protein